MGDTNIRALLMGQNGRMYTCQQNGTRAEGEKMKIELKNFKSYESMSEETLCFQASLYFDGKKVGTVENRGQGGDTWPRISGEDRKRLDEYIATLPPAECEWDEKGITYDADFFFTEMANNIHEEKRLKAMCRGKTLLRRDGHEYGKGEWDVLRVKFTPKTRSEIQKIHNVTEFLNDRLAK